MAARQGPTRQEWEANKPAIYKLYIEESRTLAEVIETMRADYDFHATKKMYTTRFEKWKPHFNKYKDSESDQIQAPRGITRQRRCRTRQQHVPQTKAMTLTTLRMRSPASYRNIEGALHSVRHYTLGLLERFTWDDFTIIAPGNVPDATMPWQFIADKSFGAKQRLIRGDIKDGMRELGVINDNLVGLMKVCHPAMMVKLWRVCHTFYQIGELKNFSLLYSFLDFSKCLVRVYHGETHPLFFFLEAVSRVSREDFVDALHVLYRRTIIAMESRLGPRHAIVLHMWSNFLKQSNETGVSLRELKERYDGLLEAAEKADESLSGSNSIAVLHGYLYTSYYNLNDEECSMRLAEKLFDRVRAQRHQDGRSQWSLPMQGFALAAKILAMINFKSGTSAKGRWFLEEAIAVLQGGDWECRTRAVYLQDTLQQHEVVHRTCTESARVEM